MSTNDVPGYNPSNRDELHGGCWAEHVDGTLLYVQGTENKNVVYEIFDLSDSKNPIEYRDRMRQADFEKKFSYDPGNAKSVKWCWHDKSLFPWDRIMKSFGQGIKLVAVEKQIKDAEKVKKARSKHRSKPLRSKPATMKNVAQIIDEEMDIDGIPHGETQAQRLARERSLKARPIEHADVQHRVDREVPKGGLAVRIRDRIQGAIDKLKPGKGG